MKPRVKRGTLKERIAYAATDPVYPMYGFVKVDGVRCVVEDLRGVGGNDDPRYEIMAPKGKHFEGEGTHSLLCFSLDDVADRASHETLVDCRPECD